MSCLKAECNVYIMPADIFSEPSLRAKALSVISDERRTRLEKYCFEKDKDLSLTAEFLLRYALYKHGIISSVSSRISLLCGKDGKPYIEGNPVYFNLSHSKEYAVCAISDVETGVDIEAIRSADLKLAERFFASEETAYLKSVSPDSVDAEFTRLWTLKESFIKAQGKGIGIGLNSFSVTDFNGNIKSVEYEDDIYYLSGIVFDGGYKGALCSKNTPVTPSLIIPDRCEAEALLT